MALGGGGYDLFARHVAGALAWIVVAALLIAPLPEKPRPGKFFALIGGLILSLAILSAISAIWSISVSASLTEFERLVGYLGFFTASYLTMRTPKQREWFARGIGAGLAVIVLLALGDRLLAGGQSVAGFSVARLSFPLGYWNANGVASAAAAVLFVWFSSRSGDRWWRVGCQGLAVLSVISMYLTYSRGGVLVASLALVLLFFLSASRLRILGTAVITVAASALILLVISGYPAIAGSGSGEPSPGDCLIVIAVALATIALAGAVLEGALALAGRNPGPAGRAVRISQDRRFLISIAGAFAMALLLVLIVFGSSAWDQFSDSDVPAQQEGKSRFTELSGSYRYDFNQVAIDVFEDHPLLGSGAGTYYFEWNQRRSIPVSTKDAHSFYLQSLSDLGLIGGLLTLGLALSVIGLGFLVWRRDRGGDSAVILALSTALLVSFGFDWFWSLGATAALLLGFAAWIASAEAVDPAREKSRAGNGLRLAGVLTAWVAIMVLAVPAIADRYQQAATSSVESGHLERAIDQARMAIRLDPWSAEPHMQLGTIAESRGQINKALAEYDRAIELEPRSWQALALKFRVYDSNGRTAEARKVYRRLNEINPLYFVPFPLRSIGESNP